MRKSLARFSWLGRVHPVVLPSVLGLFLVALVLIPIGRLDLDVALNLALVKLGAIDTPPSDIVVISLSEEDASAFEKLRPAFSPTRNCQQLPEAPLKSGVSTAWRPFHACLLDALADTGVKVIAFDITFSEEARAESASFKKAIAEAGERGQRVVLGHPGGARARLLSHDLYDAGVFGGITEGWMTSSVSWTPNVIKRITLMRRLTSTDGQDHRWVPGLGLQAYALKNGGSVQIDAVRGITYPPGLLASEALWLRYPRMAIPSVRYSDVVLRLNSDKLDHKTLAFVGVTGRWAAQYGDVHRLPWLPASQPLAGNDDRVPGVFVHAYAAHQLDQQAGVLEVSKGWALLAALIAGVLPMLVCAFVDVRPDPYRRLNAKLPIGARLARWPFIGIIGAGLILAGCAVVTVTRRDAVLPLVTMAAATLMAFVISLPARRALRASQRFVDGVERVEQIQARSRWDPLVRLPRQGGGRALRDALGLPAFSVESVQRCCELLHVCLVEAEGRQTYFQRIPRTFFETHDWAEPDPQANSQAPIARGDDLVETFIGTELRRIRNLIHPELSGNVRELGYRAIVRHANGMRWPLSAAACFKAQMSILSAATTYVESLAEWLEQDLEREPSARAKHA